jgi:hypothetical protein
MFFGAPVSQIPHQWILSPFVGRHYTIIDDKELTQITLLFVRLHQKTDEI